MTYAIRYANNDDLGSILEMFDLLCKGENENYDKTVDPDQALSGDTRRYFEGRIEGGEGNEVVFVAEEEGKIIGYLCGSLVDTESYRIQGLRVAELENMFVDDRSRSLGVGGKLQTRFEKWARDKEFNRMRVVASAHNQGAMRFYQRQGFEPLNWVAEKDLS